MRHWKLGVHADILVGTHVVEVVSQTVDVVVQQRGHQKAVQREVQEQEDW